MFDPHFWSKKKCSDFNSEHGNRPEDHVPGRLVCSDQFFDFSQKNFSGQFSAFNCAQPHMLAFACVAISACEGIALQAIPPWTWVINGARSNGPALVVWQWRRGRLPEPGDSGPAAQTSTQLSKATIRTSVQIRLAHTPANRAKVRARPD